MHETEGSRLQNSESSTGDDHYKLFDNVSGLWPGGGRQYLGPGLECAGPEEHAGSHPLLLPLPHEPGTEKNNSTVTLQLFCLGHAFKKIKDKRREVFLH